MSQDKQTKKPTKSKKRSSVFRKKKTGSKSSKDTKIGYSEGAEESKTILGDS